MFFKFKKKNIYLPENRKPLIFVGFRISVVDVFKHIVTTITKINKIHNFYLEKKTDFGIR